MNRKGCLLTLAVLLGLAAFVLHGIREGMNGEYGGHQLESALLKYLRANEGRWPANWEELAPHYPGVLTIDAGSVDRVRRYWGVAFDIDPQALLAAHPEPPTHEERANYTDDRLPVVYKLRRERPDPARPPRWFLSPLLHRVLSAEAAEKEASGNRPE